MKKPLVVVAGPTASGKTDISIQLAKKINGEIISADSMQIYKYMDIGTAKASEEEMQGIKHYLLSEIEPDEPYSVAIFQKLAKNYVNEIYAKGKIPILVGGTGFYINALIYDNDFSSVDADYSYREYLSRLAEENGNEHLSLLLKEVDYESWGKIHINNTKRLIRALEYHHQTGKKISEHNSTEKQKKPYYDVSFIILNRERDLLYNRINYRVDKMINDGLVAEVQALLDKGYSRELVSMQGLGYKEIVAYLLGETDFGTAVETLKQNTRRFAKRQLTWFRHQSDGIWLDADKQNAVEVILKKLSFFLGNSAIT